MWQPCNSRSYSRDLREKMLKLSTVFSPTVGFIVCVQHYYTTRSCSYLRSVIFCLADNASYGTFKIGFDLNSKHGTDLSSLIGHPKCFTVHRVPFPQRCKVSCPTIYLYIWQNPSSPCYPLKYLKTGRYNPQKVPTSDCSSRRVTARLFLPQSDLISVVMVVFGRS